MIRGKKVWLSVLTAAMALTGAAALAACDEPSSPSGPPSGDTAKEVTFTARAAGIDIGGTYYPFCEIEAEIKEGRISGNGAAKALSFHDGAATLSLDGMSAGEYTVNYSYTADGMTYTRAASVTLTGETQTVSLPVSSVVLNGRTASGAMSTVGVSLVSKRDDTVLFSRGGVVSYLSDSGEDARYYVEGVFDAEANTSLTDTAGLLVACEEGKPTSGVLLGIVNQTVAFLLPDGGASDADSVHRVVDLRDYEGTAGYDASRVRLGVLRDGARYLVYVNGSLAARWYCDTVAYEGTQAQPSPVGAVATTNAGGMQVENFNYTARPETLNALEGLAAEQTVDVYFIAGQSNAVGYSPAEESVLGADVRNANGYSNILYAGDGVSNSAGDHHALDWRLVTQGLGRDSDEFGAEVGMANALSEYYNFETGRTAAIIKYAVGGTSLLDKSTGENINGNWAPPSYRQQLGTAASSVCGRLYDNFVAEAERRIAELEAMGYNVRVRGMYWMQGESDRSSADRTQYETVFPMLVSDIREEFASDLAVFIGEISKAFGGQGTQENLAFIQLQNKLAGQVDGCYIVESADQPLGPDNAHFTAAGEYAIGKMVGNGILENILT